ncbi:unknown [Bacteroides sp. CAG:598]|nr:unknown [Bacteroides sp. CAG:598]
MRFTKSSYLCNRKTETLTCIGLWCNGNTTDSGPVIPGSNPGSPTEKRTLRLMRCPFLLSVCVCVGLKRRGCVKTGSTFSFFTHPLVSCISLFPYAQPSFWMLSSITLIFSFTRSMSAFSFSTLRLSSVSRLLPFFEAAFRKPRLFSYVCSSLFMLS